MNNLTLINKCNFNRIKRFFPNFSQSGLIGLFLISPLMAFPYCLCRSYKGQRIAQVLLCIFMGLLSICFVPPRADLYRQQLAFMDICNEKLQYVVDNLRFDFVLPFFDYAISRIGFDFEIIRLTFIFIPYLLFLNLYNRLRETKIDADNQILFVMSLLSVPFMELTLGMRYGLAVSIVSYVGINLFIVKDKLTISYIILLILGPCIHFGITWLPLLIIFTYYVPKGIYKYLNKTVAIGIFVILYLISYQFNDLLQLLAFDSASQQLVNHYGSDGTYGTRFIHHNLVGSIPEYYGYFMVYLTIFLFLLKMPFNKDTVLPWSVFFVWAFTHSLYSISGRIDSVILCLCPLFLYHFDVYKKTFLKLMVIGALYVIILNWRAYTISHSLYILMCPLIVLTVGYDKTWLLTYVDQFGSLKIYK